MPQLVFRINKYGDTSIDAQEFVGSSCMEASKVYEEALEGRVVNRDVKPEYYEQGANVAAQTEDNLRF